MAPSVYKVCKSRTRGKNVEKMRLLLFEVRTPLHYTKFMGGALFCGILAVLSAVVLHIYFQTRSRSEHNVAVLNSQDAFGISLIKCRRCVKVCKYICNTTAESTGKTFYKFTCACAKILTRRGCV